MLTDRRQNRMPATNTGLAKVAVHCSADTFVVNQSLVLHINICGENRHHRQYVTVSGQPKGRRQTLNNKKNHASKRDQTARHN
jgi:hypothetical protein